VAVSTSEFNFNRLQL